MTFIYTILAFFLGVLTTLAFVWTAYRRKQQWLEAQYHQKEFELRTRYENQFSLSQQFESLAAKALQNTNQDFIRLAKEYFSLNQQQAEQKSGQERKLYEQTLQHMMSEVKGSLEKVDIKMNELEKTREGTFQSLVEQLRTLGELQHRLHSETSNLSKALRSPNARGRWGEIQLKRVVEMAGMLEHCDFELQTTQTKEEDSQARRPDLIINLPANRTIVVDAKTPIDAYIKATESKDPQVAEQFYLEYASNLKRQIQLLGQKTYWQQFESSPDFVVMFVPGEPFFSTALQYEPSLIEFGVEQKVLIATPTTLIALLRTAAYGWRQEALATNAQEVSRLGAELHTRLQTFVGYIQELGTHLQRSVLSYNKMMGGLESRVLSTAKKFSKMSGQKNSPLETIAQNTIKNVELRSPQNIEARGLTTESLTDDT